MALVVGVGVAATLVPKHAVGMECDTLVGQGLARLAVHQVAHNVGAPFGRGVVVDKDGVARLVQALAEDTVGVGQQPVGPLFHGWQGHQIGVAAVVARVGQLLLPLFDGGEAHEGVAADWALGDRGVGQQAEVQQPCVAGLDEGQPVALGGGHIGVLYGELRTAYFAS